MSDVNAEVGEGDSCGEAASKSEQELEQVLARPSTQNPHPYSHRTYRPTLLKRVALRKGNNRGLAEYCNF
jgi:hypothetical protein